MASKKYIIKQTTNWNGKGEKTGTHTVIMDAAELSLYVGVLEGKIEVYEMNEALSFDGATATTSLHIADFIALKHSQAKTVYISNANKRPIVFKQNVGMVIEMFKSVKPFPAPFNADFAKDVSVDTGNINLL